jgi:polysaccharide export outer membrane protein
MAVRLFIFLLVLLFATGCEKLPGAGPSARIVDPPSSRAAPAGYEVVDLDRDVYSLLERHSGPSLAGSFGIQAAAPTQQFGVGDAVQVTIFEAGPGGLFTPQTDGPFVTGGGRQTVIPVQTVDRDGRISVPYAGTITAAGRTPKEVAESVRAALSRRALEPQVIVTLANNAAATASVLGEVTTGGKVNLGIRGERVLDVIAAAGGVKAPEHETFIRLMRGGRTSTVPLRSIIRRPSENIYVHPQDTLLVIRERQMFTALGAVTTQGAHAIPSGDFALSEALGTAGGLLDARADHSGVFLFRFERGELVQALAEQGKLSDRGTYMLAQHGIKADIVYPIVYRIRLSRPETFFVMSRVRVQHRDILYASNAFSTEVDKFVNLVTKIYGLIRGPVSIAELAN